MGVRVLASLFVLLCAAAGCNSFPDGPFACARADQCVRGGESGLCIDGYCAFVDPACEGFRFDESAAPELAGQCVPGGSDAGPVGDDDGGRADAGRPRDGGTVTDNGCGGRAMLPAAPETPCGPCGRGTFKCDGTERLRCDMELSLELDVTSEGTVSASTEFSSSFQAELAVDGDLSTSWFSSGVEPSATQYRWRSGRDDCITRVQIEGNGAHSNSSFRTDFGFGQVTVQVLDEAGTVVSSQVEGLPGTPDPTVVSVPTAGGFEGAWGREVLLLFTGHESSDCGGFSELNVSVKR